MNRTLAVLQPSYLPWLGYFDQVRRSDYFVHLDDVQFDRGGWRNRNRILLNGDVHWLTIPVAARFGTQLRDIHLPQDSRWKRKHLQSLHHGYAGTLGYPQIRTILSDVFEENHQLLVDMSTALVERVAWELGIESSVHRASQLNIGGHSWARLIAMCKHFQANRYLTGPAARNYLDEKAFACEGIEVVWHEFEAIPYPQRATKFISHLSFIDAACAVGLASVRQLLKGD